MSNKTILLVEFDRLIRRLERGDDTVDDLFILTVQMKLKKLIEKQQQSRTITDEPMRKYLYDIP